ncbi:isoprenyl transferase [Christensenellaceae bacterium OttesenSCG-928-K19]|nr:isoprenyl transferase [Christensenellaceae bacterium OttesenSCG-928-K19]
MFGKKKKVDLTELDRERLPVHVAVIMDGNGRWAKKRLLPRVAGHSAGVSTVKKIMRMSSDLGIRYLTLYAFSTENWKRPKEEVSALMRLVIDSLRRELEEMHEENVVFNTLGEISQFPDEVVDVLVNAKEKTKNNTGITVNFALNYGARSEIVRAVRKIAHKVEQKELSIDQIDEEQISQNLYTVGQPDPDFLIRTSGEERLSNYLLYQLAYAEFYFTPVYWPDFTETEYKKALLEFQNRKRRYGGL